MAPCVVRASGAPPHPGSEARSPPRVQGKSSDEIEEVLGHLGCSEEVVHRDNIGLLSLMERNLPANRGTSREGPPSRDLTMAADEVHAESTDSGMPAAAAGPGGVITLHSHP